MTASRELGRQRAASAALMVYAASITIAFVSVGTRAYQAQRFGYTWMYLEYDATFLASHPLLYLADRIEQVATVAFWMLLAAQPTRRVMRLTVPLYVLYLLVTVLTGQRGALVAGVLTLGVYYITRYGVSGIRGRVRVVIAAVVGAPLAFLGLAEVASRRGLGGGGGSALARIVQFVYDQGVTSRVIYNDYVYASLIPANTNPLLEWTRTGLLGRLLGYQVHAGNTVEHALDGSSFTHGSGYAILGDLYLQGQGTGTSFIAELFHQGGYPLVAVGSLVIAVLLQRCARLDPAKPIFSGFKFSVIPTLLYIARGPISSPLTFWLAPATLGAVLLIVGLTWISEHEPVRPLRAQSDVLAT
jgi:oligosaccharide repeat unit polymerase